MRCISSSELHTIEQTLKCYGLTACQTSEVMRMVEQRAMDTSAPFKAYDATHAAASRVINNLLIT